MAHFAKISASGVVEQVIVVSNDDCAGGEYPEACPAGNAFINSLTGLEGTWKQTSYNGNFRGKYAGISDRYDEELDEFVSPVVEPPVE